MIEPNQTAYIVQVVRAEADMPNTRLSVLYAVIADDAQSAAQLVKAAVKENAEVELTQSRLSQDTAVAIELTSGYARAL